MACSRVCGVVSSALLDYNTSKLVHIRNQKIGLIYRLVQLGVIVYIIGYVIVIKKGYQETDTVLSSVTAKMKGMALVKGNHTDAIWDVADYVVPPQQTDSVFVTTNAIITENQTYGVCPEDSYVAAGSCDFDADCPADTPVRNGNGWRNGTCDNSTHTCFIYAWCPTETDVGPSTPLLGDDPKNFTLFIKNNVQFEKFHFHKSNVLEATSGVNISFLRNCTYNASDPQFQYCPIFRLGTILDEANEDYEPIALKGGIMGIFITWNCNLDYSTSHCEPKYKFKRLDNAKAAIAPGYSFRYPIYYFVNGVKYRQLVKAYGIRFQILVSGTAGRFSVVPLFLNIGSGIALLGISTVLCDLLVLYVVKRRKYYKDNKYETIEDEEALFGPKEKNLQDYKKVEE
ncbi:P2X purinoceptor 4-like [Oscarella lobularis]|uniref:P2X purinoceptor 4-like n=1 Tax=Oscarella lobularis TaxID=121494 RepID=UPI003313B083